MIIDFRPHTPETWLAEYRKDIRVAVEWSIIKIKSCAAIVVGPYNVQAILKIYYPWAEKQRQNWMDSEKNKLMKLGESPILIRAPALEINAADYLLLDRCHRIRDLKPALVILDAIIVSPPSYKYFADLKSPFFQRLLNS